LKHKIVIDQLELINFTKQLLRSNYANYGVFEIDENELSQNAMNFLQDKSQTDAILSRLAEEKIISLCKTEGTIKEKIVSYEEFIQK